MPAAVPGANSGAPLTKWSSKVSSTSGSRSDQDTPGAGGHRDEVAAEKDAFDHAAVEQGARPAAMLRRMSASGKSRVPASITVWPGRNLRVAGLGVCSVRISICAMWPESPIASREGGSAFALQMCDLGPLLPVMAME